MKSSEEMRVYLQRLMRWGLERPGMYGGSPYGANGIFWYWRFIWAQLMERVSDFYSAINAAVGGDALNPQFSIEPSADSVDYEPVVSFWRDVDRHLAIEYPPDAEKESGAESGLGS